MTGIEPVTSSLPRKRSTPELHRHGPSFCQALGAGDEARTRDLQLGRLSLYQLSYSRIPAFPTMPHARARAPMVGRAGFEPAKAYANRFTVCPV